MAHPMNCPYCLRPMENWADKAIDISMLATNHEIHPSVLPRFADGLWDLIFKERPTTLLVPHEWVSYVLEQLIANGRGILVERVDVDSEFLERGLTPIHLLGPF